MNDIRISRSAFLALVAALASPAAAQTSPGNVGPIPGATPAPSAPASPGNIGPIPGGANPTPASPAMPNTAGRRPGAAPAGPGGTTQPEPDVKSQLDNVPPIFRKQVGAALEFIDAAKERDPEALAEATALRAPKDPDVSTKHQKLFQAILDKELPDEQLDELATQFTGYRVQEVIIGKSTGRANIVFAKPTRNDRLEKTIVVRKEKAGWKVTDFTGDRSHVGRKSTRKSRS